MSLINDKLQNIWEKIKSQNNRGLEWIGIDGIANAESAALLTLFLMMFCSIVWAMAISMFIVMGKCIFDRTRGHENEKHDLICACIGVLVGAILGFALSHASLVLF